MSPRVGWSIQVLTLFVDLAPSHTMVLWAAVVSSFLFRILILGSLTNNPRLWKQDFPDPLQEELAPLSLSERIERPLAILLGCVVIGLPLLSLLTGQSSRGQVTLLDGLLHFWLIFMGVSLVDLVVIDSPVGMRWQPAFLNSPAIDPLRQHDTIRFHVGEHLKGALLLTGLASVLGGTRIYTRNRVKGTRASEVIVREVRVQWRNPIGSVSEESSVEVFRALVQDGPGGYKPIRLAQLRFPIS